MSQVVRIALPGYDALTDTDPDHFSLYSDIDNVLIKRFATGQSTIADGSPTILDITHNLNYIPFFIAYYSPLADGVWSILNNQYNPFSVPDALAAIDTTKLHLYNFGGHGSGNIKPAYDIFYDDMSQTGSPSIVESLQAFKIVRPGKDALSTKNPNDYIMHSDLNNFKILKQAKVTGVTIPGTGAFLNIPHGVDVSEPYKFFCFVKAPDGKTFLTGNAMHLSYDESFAVVSQMDATNISLRSWLTASNKTVDVFYIIYGTGKPNTINNTGEVISVTKNGSSVLTENNPDNFNFHSNYRTLKYYNSGVWDMGSVTAQTEKVIAHNLGYTPFHVSFINDLAGIITNAYAIVPYYWSRSSIPSPNKNIASFTYVDSTNIYLKQYYQVNAIGFATTPKFYYKIFKNNLGL